MFDLDVSKMIVVGIVALAVIPPKDLPRVMRTVGQFVGKMRRMAAEFQGQFMDALREADLESVKKEFEAISEQAKIETNFDPAAMMRDDMTKAVQAPAEIGKSDPVEIGKSEVALAGPEPVESRPGALPAETETQPEAPPAARQSAAE